MNVLYQMMTTEDLKKIEMMMTSTSDDCRNYYPAVRCLNEQLYMHIHHTPLGVPTSPLRLTLTLEML